MARPPARYTIRPTFYPHQLPVFDCPARHVVYVKGRRAGGTHGAVNRLVELAHLRPGTRHLWVDTVQRNIERYVRRYFLPLLAGTPHRWNRSGQSLRFASGAACDFGSAERPEHLEGFGYDYLWVNEAGLVLRNEALYFETLLPMVLEAPGAQIFLVGAPKGPGLFERMYGWGQDPGRPDWAAFHHTSYVNPRVERGAVDALRAQMPDAAFRQEVLAEFVEDAEAVFRGVERAAAAAPEQAPHPEAPYVLGVDLGRYHDYTVVWAGRADTHTAVACDRFRGLPWSLQVARLAAWAAHYHGAPLYVDATAAGDAICEELERAGLVVRRVVFTAPRKRALIERLAIAIERGRLRLVPHRQTVRELHAYRYSRTPTGAVRSGGHGDHDDCVMALALCHEGMSTHHPAGTGFILGTEMEACELD